MKKFIEGEKNIDDLEPLTPEQKRVYPKVPLFFTFFFVAAKAAKNFQHFPSFQLYQPGAIFHMKRVRDENCSDPRSSFKYIIEKSSRENLAEIVISPSMVEDHLPTGYDKALKELLKSAEESSWCALSSFFFLDPCLFSISFLVSLVWFGCDLWFVICLWFVCGLWFVISVSFLICFAFFFLWKITYWILYFARREKRPWHTTTRNHQPSLQRPSSSYFLVILPNHVLGDSSSTVGKDCTNRAVGKKWLVERIKIKFLFLSLFYFPAIFSLLLLLSTFLKKWS